MQGEEEGQGRGGGGSHLLRQNMVKVDVKGRYLACGEWDESPLWFEGWMIEQPETETKGFFLLET